MKKKKGNALLLLIVVIMVIVTLGATLTSAIAYTTKQNVNDKNIEDLILVAESGIEYAITNVRVDGVVGYTINTENTTPTSKDTKLKQFKPNNYRSIVVEIGNEVNKKILLRSTAVDGKGRSKTVYCNLIKTMPISGDILSNALVASESKIAIEGAGSLDLQTTKVNSPEEPVYISTGSINKPTSRTDIAYNQLKFIENFKKKSIVNVSSISGLATGFKDGSGNSIATKDLNSIVTSGGSVSEFSGVGYFTLDGYKVYLVNADELNVNLPDGGNAEHYTILICSGKINLNPIGSTKQFTLDASESTFYGKGITIPQKGSIKMNKSPKDRLTADQFKNMNRKIKLFIENWPVEPATGEVVTPDTPSYVIVTGDYRIE